MAASDKPGRVLVVDDEWSIRDVLSNILQSEGFEVETAQDGDEAIALLEDKLYDLVITDLKMPRVHGMEVLRHLSKLNVHTLGIVATGYGSIESAVEALRLGAFDYITKPFHLDEIKIVVHKAREFQALQTENRTLRRELKRSGKFENIIGNSAKIKSMINLIHTVADSDSTILILGESGTGKELVARAVHYNSPRADQPLIPVNCGAIPEDLLESELFGHVKGAFTGATMNRVGRFQLADGGTIFLDEIGDMSPKLQVKLLRVLQEQAFEPVGATETVRVNVRIITATNRDLEADVADGRFREDLFYRLNVIPIHIPPLRERAEDIPILIDHFVERFNKLKGRRVKGFRRDAIEALMAYPWPGNVRELENLVERMVILNPDGEITEETLPERFTGHKPRPLPMPSEGLEIPDEGIDFNALVDQFETQLIERALEKAGGIKNKAAALLQIKRTTLVEKMKKKGMLE
ncbi:MAG TPA: sigma-54 dependent transcriptional regulator [Candidatus Sumerlaeota bacterium]|nr:sigma-54 dependent transcriptional regulator [Candidatus Sumerlaeota bacterium]HPK01657.1 sigma-54 dependent transcriptional regulator [Candidatus Sumerlaeota bacterium]